jgi:hypothetical protein
MVWAQFRRLNCSDIGSELKSTVRFIALYGGPKSSNTKIRLVVALATGIKRRKTFACLFINPGNSRNANGMANDMGDKKANSTINYSIAIGISY